MYLVSITFHKEDPAEPYANTLSKDTIIKTRDGFYEAFGIQNPAIKQARVELFSHDARLCVRMSVNGEIDKKFIADTVHVANKLDSHFFMIATSKHFNEDLHLVTYRNDEIRHRHHTINGIIGDWVYPATTTENPDNNQQLKK